MDKEYRHEGEKDWEKADSVLFNSFIFLQLFNEVSACECVSLLCVRAWVCVRAVLSASKLRLPLHRPCGGAPACCSLRSVPSVSLRRCHSDDTCT
jgi:hypothetical protein